jgi:2-keto-4-pentenoate hydratase
MRPFVHDGDADLVWSDYVNCAVEPEFVFRIGQDVTPEFIERRSIAESIEYIAPGIEVHHYRFWYGEPSFQELIASNAIHACLVVGHEKTKPENLDLEMEGVGLFVGADLAASGIGAETFGGPLKSLAWLAGNLIQRGEHLKAGDLVIPGSPVKLVPVARGDEVTVRFTRLGSVRARFH